MEKRIEDRFNQEKWAPFAGPGHWNDPDMLITGTVGWGKPKPTSLTQDEQYTHLSLWCLLSAPLLIGCDLNKLDDFTVNLLSNDEVLDVDQDALGHEATPVYQDKDYAIYAKTMEDGSCALGLFNVSDKPRKIAVKWADLKLVALQRVRDLWRQKELGVFADGFSSEVAPHGVRLVRVWNRMPPSAQRPPPRRNSEKPRHLLRLEGIHRRRRLAVLAPRDAVVLLP